MQSSQIETRTSVTTIDVGQVTLAAELSLPAAPKGLVMLTWSDRDSCSAAGISLLAELLNEVGFATIVAGLLSDDEELIDSPVGHLRFNPILLGRRLVGITDWADACPETERLPVGYFAVATAATGALLAAAERPERVRALVSWAGRPDLVAARLADVAAPTLLAAEKGDSAVCRLNRLAASMLGCERRLAIVSGAPRAARVRSLSFEFAGLTVGWFTRFLAQERPSLPQPVCDP